MKIWLLVSSFLVLVLPAHATVLQDPPGFPQGWEMAMEQSCTTAGHVTLRRTLFAREGKEFFTTNEKNGVRFMQQMGTFDKDGISWRTEVQKGDQALAFEHEYEAL